MEETHNKRKLIEEAVSERFSDKIAKDLEELAVNEGYDSIRFFIAPDKTVSPESVIEDARAFFLAEKENKEVESLYYFK